MEPRESSRVRLKAQQIRALAARRNESLDELARAIGIDERRFYRLMSGKVSPNPQTRSRICRKLKVDFDDIFEIVDGATLAAAGGQETSHA